MKGHIRERSRGRWAIVLDVRDSQTGERKRRWHSFAGTKRQAQVECARLISEMQGGVAVDPSRITIAAFLDRFERDWVAVHVSAHSAGRYRGALGHVRRHLGDAQLQKVRPADVAGFYATLSRSGLAARTIRLVHCVLHRALAQAKTWARHPRQRDGERKAAPGTGSGNADAATGSGAGIAGSASWPSTPPPGLAGLGHRNATERNAGAAVERR